MMTKVSRGVFNVFSVHESRLETSLSGLVIAFISVSYSTVVVANIMVTGELGVMWL